VKAIQADLIWDGSDFLSDSALLVDGKRTAGIVDRGSVPIDADAVDWGRVALLPGTVNAHGHSFQNLLKGFADDRPFDGWRDDILYPFSERLDGDAIYVGAMFAFIEALLAGVTSTVDFFYLHDRGNDNARAVIQAAHDAGIRLVFARALYDVDAPTAAPVRYREPVGEAVARCKELAEEYEGDPLISVQPAPHSLHAASPQTIRAALELARDLDVPCHLHLAEAAYERDQIIHRYGTTPVRLLEREGLLDPRLVAIHTVWADDEELDLLAEAGVGVVHCPGANAFLGDGTARVPEMLARGMRVGLGPDGGCANNRQSVFDEMRTATLMAKARLTDGGALDAPTALRLGTIGGADLLGLAIGSLDAGRQADAVALDLTDLSLQPPGNLERLIVSSMQPTAIARVMVGGEVVMDGGRPTRFDLADLRARISEVTRGWTRP
jgi:5-methylthioadenosine/S-adenosylhomocysteine deaminase